MAGGVGRFAKKADVLAQEMHMSCIFELVKAVMMVIGGGPLLCHLAGGMKPHFIPFLACFAAKANLGLQRAIGNVI
eukprot:191862-Pelagomonas_calceolata.AAC.2